MKRILYSVLVLGLITGNVYCSKDKKEAEEDSELFLCAHQHYGGETHVGAGKLIVACDSPQGGQSPRTIIKPPQQRSDHESLYDTPEEGASPRVLAKHIKRSSAPMSVTIQDQNHTRLIASSALAVAVQPAGASGANSVHSTAPLKKLKRAKSAPALLDKKGSANEAKKPATRQAHAKSAAEKAQEKTQE